MRKANIFMSGLCLAFSLWGSVPDVSAYHCADPHFKSKKCRVAHSYANSDAVFMGQLLSVDQRESESGWPVYTSEFFVKESYLGNVSGQIKVISESGQNPPGKVAGHYIVFVTKAGTGKYFTNPCSDYRFVEVESPLVDHPMQTELRRMATTKNWTFKNENCVAESTVIIKPDRNHPKHDHAVYDSRDQKD